MFALALWDARRQQLLLARDRLGKKPLVYRDEPGRLLFASELKSLLEVPGVPREIDPQAIDAYLTYQYVPHPRTIFRGIAKLPPGHYAVYRDGRLEVRRYWQPDFNASRRTVAAAGVCRAVADAACARRSRLRTAERGAAGGLPFRRRRFEHRRRPDARADRASRCGRSPSASTCRSTTRPAMPGWSPERFQTVHEEFRVEPRCGGDPAPAGVALRRAVCRQPRPCPPGTSPNSRGSMSPWR